MKVTSKSTNTAILALTLSACVSAQDRHPDQSAVRGDASVSGSATGQIVEFKSGPEGFDTRTFFYIGEQDVVAFDAQFTPELARQSLRELRKHTDKPVRWLVITHPNPDKFNGASEFRREGARIISSSATAAAISGVHDYKQYYFTEVAKMFTKEQYPQPTPIDQVFVGQTEIVLRGGERLQLRELNHPGVSSTQTVAYLANRAALFVGDLIHYGVHSWLEGGILNGQPRPDLHGWKQNLRELQKNFPAKTIVYGGRGEPAPLAKAIETQIRYLESAQTLVRLFLQELGPRSAELSGPLAPQHYKELGLMFARAFPAYDLLYLIEYGAYGLVQSEMQSRSNNE